MLGSIYFVRSEVYVDALLILTTLIFIYSLALYLRKGIFNTHFPFEVRLGSAVALLTTSSALVFNYSNSILFTLISMSILLILVFTVSLISREKWRFNIKSKTFVLKEVIVDNIVLAQGAFNLIFYISSQIFTHFT